MRIITLPEFLALPPMTLFAKYDIRGNFGDLSFKHVNSGIHSDFYYSDLIEVKSRGSDEFNDILERAEEPVVLDDEPSWSRDGLYEEKQLYAVFDQDEVRMFINLLRRCLHSATPPQADIATAKQRLEYLRGEIEAERISYEESAELESLKEYIEEGDVQLLEWAGVPEKH